jgi:hypothetical protein
MSETGKLHVDPDDLFAWMRIRVRRVRHGSQRGYQGRLHQAFFTGETLPSFSRGSASPAAFDGAEFLG